MSGSGPGSGGGAPRGALAGYRHEPFTHDGVSRSVFVAGEGPPVLVMHEVPGLHPGVVAFADRVRARGFKVYLPSMFGTPGRPVGAPYLGRTIARVCLSREFAVLALRRASPITEWLRALARHAHAETGLPVGAIGMCLTGGFALNLAVDAHLRAPVLSQPSTPFAVSPLHARDLGIADADLARVKGRCVEEGLCVLGLRFSMDLLTPAARFARLAEELGDRFLAVEIDSRPGNAAGIPPWAHSVLSLDLVDRPGHPTHDALQRTLAFFERHLGAG